VVNIVRVKIAQIVINLVIWMFKYIKVNSNKILRMHKCRKE